MALFSTVADSLSYVEECQRHFPYLNGLLKPHRRRYWTRTLEAAQDQLDDFILGSPYYNLLMLSATTGLSLAMGRDDEFFTRYRRLLARLGTYLQSFPELLRSPRFRDKITNVEGLDFLATLSELALAYQLANQGFKVTFETKFKHSVTGSARDIDLSLRDAQGHVLHLEVYMPHQQMDVQGFFDPAPDVREYAGKIEHKLAAKFGQHGIEGLDGLVLLAVNKAFADMVRVQEFFKPGSFNYEGLLRRLPPDVDGLLVFVDDFDADNSLQLDQLLVRKPNG